MQIKRWNTPAMLCFLFYTAADFCIVNNIHALAFSCNTAFLNHSLFSTLTTNLQKIQTITAVKKAREENQWCKNADSMSYTLP